MYEVITQDCHFCLGVASVSRPIKFQDSLISNITEKNQTISLVSGIKIIIKGRWHLKLTLLVSCGQVCLWSSRIPGFFDHR